MSLANYISKNNQTNEKEFKIGDIDFDLTDVECVTLRVEEKLEAPEIIKINEEITNIKSEITAIKNDIIAFKQDTLDVVNQILQALQIDNVNKKITTDYNFEVTGNLSQG